MGFGEHFRNLTIRQMLDKLNEMYDKEETILEEIKKLTLQYEQLKEDSEMLETMIMYTSNRLDRIDEVR